MQKFREELKGLEASKGGTSKEIEEKESQIQELRQTIENSGELFVEIQDEIEKAKKTREDLTSAIKISYRSVKISPGRFLIWIKKSSVWRARRTVMKKLPRSRSIICGKSMNSLIIVRWSLGMKI
mgnify:FL=1